MWVPRKPTEEQGGGFPAKGAACPRGWTMEVLRTSTLDMAPKVSVWVADVFRCPSPRLGWAVQGCFHSGYQSWQGLELGLDLAMAAAEWWFAKPVPVLLPALSTSPVTLHKQTKQNTAPPSTPPPDLLLLSCSPFPPPTPNFPPPLPFLLLLLWNTFPCTPIPPKTSVGTSPRPQTPARLSLGSPWGSSPLSLCSPSPHSLSRLHGEEQPAGWRWALLASLAQGLKGAAFLGLP